MNPEQDKTRLSINRFRDRDISNLSDEDYQDYVLAKLMQDIIQHLEGAIESDRMFQRAKHNVMSSVWAASDLLRARDNKE